MLLQVLDDLSIRIPCFAPTLVPTNKAIGVASPIAHGHAIIITVIAILREDSVPIVGRQNKNVVIAKIMTAGTNILAILSTVLSILPFVIAIYLLA